MILHTSYGATKKKYHISGNPTDTQFGCWGGGTYDDTLEQMSRGVAFYYCTRRNFRNLLLFKEIPTSKLTLCDALQHSSAISSHGVRKWEGESVIIGGFGTVTNQPEDNGHN